MRAYLPALAIMVSAAAGVAFAQAPVYRSTMPDGKKVLSDRPMPGAIKVEEIKVSPGNTAPGNPVTKSTPKPGDRPATLDEAQAGLRKAQQEYDAAVAAAEKGREEIPGDRQGTASGGARFTDAYNDRQARLKQEVEAAKGRLDEAQRKANNAR